MPRSGRNSLEKLTRFRRLSEDRAASALQTAARTATEAAESLEGALRNRDTVTEWKISIATVPTIPLDLYAQSLEMEVVASEAVEREIVSNRKAVEFLDAALAGYWSALNAVRVVERRSERRSEEESIRNERGISDLVSDLWLARRSHDRA